MILEVPGRSQTVNALRAANRWVLAKEVSNWRESAGWQLKVAKLGPAPVPCNITVEHFIKSGNGRKRQDIGAAWYAIKACVDSLVDVKVLIDDSPQYLASVTLTAPVMSDHDALRFTIEAVDA